MSNKNLSDLILSQYESSLADGESIQSEWIDCRHIDKIQFSAFASVSGMTVTIDSRTDEKQTPLSSTVIYNDGPFYMFNVICRQRFMRFAWSNNTGSTVTNVSLDLKASFGSSDKLSVFPVGVNPSDFSQAALVQSISRGRQPDGDYVSVAADGSSFSTSTLLDADETFTSAWSDSDGWSSIELFIDSDVVGAFQGICVDFTDNVQATTPTIRETKKYTFTQLDAENGALILKIPALLDGYRVSYTNGETAQSTFYMDATLRVGSESLSFNKGGGLVVASFETEAALGRISNYSIDSKFGRVKEIDNADSAVDIWAFADDTTSPRADTKTFPTTASTFYLASSSSSDTAVNVEVNYIDADGYAQNTIVTLNGQTGVSLGDTALDVNRMSISGSTTAVGLIYCCTANNFTSGTPTTPSQCVASIPIGYGQTQQSQFTVPRDKVLIIKSYNISISRSNGSAGSAALTLRVKEFGETSKVKREFFPTTAYAVDIGETSIKVEERSQIVWRIDDVSDNGTNISAIWKYELIDK